MRTFARLRQILAMRKEFAKRIGGDGKEYDPRFKVVFDILKQLMEPSRLYAVGGILLVW